MTAMCMSLVHVIPGELDLFLTPSPGPNNAVFVIICELPRYSMGRITPPFRQLYQETVSDLQTESKAALVDLGHKSAFDLLLRKPGTRNRSLIQM